MASSKLLCNDLKRVIEKKFDLELPEQSEQPFRSEAALLFQL
ncbi:hypothetical protein [Ileibacterium valens]|nr:hypothetical protein [Ileibacterium valens]